MQAGGVEPADPFDDRELQLRAVEIAEPDLGEERRAGEPDTTLVVDVAAAVCTNVVIAKLKELLAAHPGRSPVQVRFLSSQGVTPLDVGGHRVEPGAGLLSELRALLGPEAVSVVRRPREPVIAVPEVVTARS